MQRLYMKTKKRNLLVLLSTLFILSCSNNVSTTRNEVVTNEDSIELNGSLRDIPLGFTTIKYAKYVAKNDEEARFIHDMYDMLKARQDKDCEKIVELYYPDYIKLIQHEIPEKSVDEIKDLLKLYLEENVEEMNATFTNQWKYAVVAGLCITDIKNRVKEGDGILYLYEYHNTLISETDTIFKKEAEYSIAASLDNGNTWYAINPEGGDLNEVFEILGVSFSHKAIDEVLTEN